MVLAAIVSMYSCGKNCTNVTYGFELPVKALPDKDTLNIGDTLWFEINHSTDFINTDGKKITFSNAANLGSLLSFDKLSIAGTFTDHAANLFIFILKEGTEIKAFDNTWERNYLFAEKDAYYKFLLAVIPKEKGKFRLLFSNSNNTFRKNDKCTKANFTINFRNTNQHYYLSPFYTGQTNLVGGDYYFVVK
jgi:hypothetical protein